MATYGPGTVHKSQVGDCTTPTVSESLKELEDGLSGLEVQVRGCLETSGQLATIPENTNPAAKNNIGMENTNWIPLTNQIYDYSRRIRMLHWELLEIRLRLERL